MRFVTAVILVAAFVHCGKHKVTLDQKVAQGLITVDELYKEANKLMRKRSFLDARRWYRAIETQAPNSPYFSHAKLGVADSYFFDRTSTKIEASVEYKSFLTHFPTHPKADYAQYQYAMCFFTEIESADRDQTSTWTAYTEFKNLMDRFPGSPYSEKAKEKIDLCLLRLADHEFTVGYYYYRRGRGFERSAESRFKHIINNYEGQFEPLRTYYYLAETLWRLEKYAEAAKYFEYLERNFPESEYQAFVEDKLARFVRIQDEGYDPGESSSIIPLDQEDSAK
ncbi:MAG: outer membrane protein assembly factor BamD [Acidobacteria bacterium]|nr:outer membrane protein assembly factor BamD [Acidobacteriota bacterium]